MSGKAGSIKSAASPAGKTASQSGQTDKAPKTPTRQESAPRSIPEVSESQLEGSSGENEGEMVPAAGRINDDGEVIDDDGNPIGKVTDGEASKFAGYIVTQEGDILDEDGGVVGRAEPLDDVTSDLNYTTRSAKDTVTGDDQQEEDEQEEDQQEGGSGGLGDTVKGAANTAGSAVGGATKGAGQAAKGAVDTAGDTAKGAADTAGEATGTQDATGAVRDNVKGATDTVGDTAEGATGDAGDAAQGATDSAADKAQDATGDVEGAAKDATGAAGETNQGATDEAGDATKDPTGDLQDKAEDTTGDLQNKAGDATGDAEGATQDAKGAADETVEGAAKEATSNAQEAAEDATGEAQDAAQDLTGDAQDVIGDKAGAAQDAKGEAGEAAEGAAETAKGGAEEIPADAKEADLGSKAQDLGQQPLDIASLSPSVRNKVIAMFQGPFTIADGGKVKDQSGKVLGNLTAGSDIQDLVGKDVKGIDEEGNLLGENDTVLGKIDIAPEGSMADRVKDEVPEAADRLNAQEQAQQALPIQIPSFAPSVAGKVIAMFQSPFKIAEDGQVTDQNGKILGKLAEGQDFKSLVGKSIKGIDEHGNLLGDNATELGKVDLVPEGTIAERIKEEVPEAAERLDAIEAAKQQAEEESSGPELPSISILEGRKINKLGKVVDQEGRPIGQVTSGDLKRLVGKAPDKNGKIWDDRGNVIGEVEVLPEPEPSEHSPFEDFPDATVDKDGKVIFDGRQVGVVVGDDWQNLIGKKVDPDGDILDKNGNVLGHAERQEAEEPEEPEEPEEAPIDYSMLRDKKVNKLGNVVDEKGQVWGQIVRGILKHLVGKKVGDGGQIFNEAGQVIGKAEPIPDSEREEVEEPAPFEDFPGAVVGDDGAVIFNGEKIGEVVEGDAKKLKGKSVDADGDILDRAGNKLGHAERWEAEAPEPEPEVDMSSLAGKRINKAGNAVDSQGEIYGRVIEGSLARLVGKICDKEGCIRNEGGEVIGRCELIPEAEREGMKEGPFAELEGCTVTKDGKVVTPGGEVVGRLVSGDPRVLAGRPVDDDGDILDKNGNTLGHAERWEEPEEEKEVNPMSGHKVNREGNVIDENGEIMGKLTSGVLNDCIGKKIDDDGDVLDQKGNKIGHCHLLSEIPDDHKEISPMSGRKVNREGNVVDENGDVIGKLTSGALNECIGKTIDDDADVLDPKGNKIGHCHLLSEIPDEDKEISPMSGRRVNREGNVVDDNGDIIGKLTSGDLSECIGKKIDDDADVVDQKGNVLGHCSLLAEIPEEPEPEPEETEEERQARLQREQDSKIAGQIAYCIEQSLDKLKPICRMIVEAINIEEAKKEEDRDEEELVKKVRPLIEEGGKILTEANGVIRGLDPDGRISAQAKHHTAGREATPEEYHLAELLKELTGTVTETIENAKRKLENLPKAKKAINPLWALLSEPLFQIIAAVGLLLSGVLGLVGKLLNGLGLGGLVNNLLGGLGLNKVLDGLGLGSVLGPLTGKK